MRFRGTSWKILAPLILRKIARNMEVEGSDFQIIRC